MSLEESPLSQDQAASPRTDAPSSLFRGGSAEPGSAASSPSRDEPPTPSLLTEEQIWRIHRLYEMLGHGWDMPKTQREIQYVGQNLPLCESCRLASATLRDHGFRVCAECKNGGCNCDGCAEDRAWSMFKDEVRPGL